MHLKTLQRDSISRDILHVYVSFISPIHKYGLEKKLIKLSQQECNNLSEPHGGKAQRMSVCFFFPLCHENPDTAFYTFLRSYSELGPAE